MVISLIGATIVVFGLAHAKDDPINVFIRAEGYAIGPEQIAALRAKWGLGPTYSSSIFDMARQYRPRRSRPECRQQPQGHGHLVGKMACNHAIGGRGVDGWHRSSAYHLGILSAMRRASILDYFLKSFCTCLGQSVPAFWVGIVGIWVFAVLFGMATRADVSMEEQMQVSLGQFQYFVIARLGSRRGVRSQGICASLRSAMLEVLDSEYIKLARAKGMGYPRRSRR